MVCRKSVQQHDRWAVSLDFVVNFRIAALDRGHRKILHRRAPETPLWHRGNESFPDFGSASAYGLVAGCPPGAASANGSSGMMTQAIGYESKPMPVMTDEISQTMRTRVTSRSKYSAKPRQTPAILRPWRGRTRRLRAMTAPMRLPQ